MTRFLVLCIALIGPVVAADTTPSASADEWKQRADRWLELERRTAAEAGAWRSEREVLETSQALMQAENERLQKRLESNALARELFTTRLQTLEAELARQESARTSLRDGLDNLEQRLRGLSPSLPPPLRDQTDDLLRRLDRGAADGANGMTLSERAQTLVSILTLIDQFNANITLTHHLYRDDAGEEIDVQVLYWGLAMGLGVDATGSHAWILQPSAEAGWQWRETPEQAAAIRRLVDIHERKQSPELVSVSVSLPEVQP